MIYMKLMYTDIFFFFLFACFFVFTYILFLFFYTSFFGCAHVLCKTPGRTAVTMPQLRGDLNQLIKLKAYRCRPVGACVVPFWAS